MEVVPLLFQSFCGQPVVVVVEVPCEVPAPKPPVGRRLAHAAIAAFTFGLDVVEVERPRANPPDSVTPWSFRQLV
jgi:hypothetical protein